jgi:hypothetical protein
LSRNNRRDEGNRDQAADVLAMMRALAASPGDVIRIEKVAPDGRPVITYDGWLISDAEPILILARWEKPDLSLPYTTFARGDLLLETYYRQRPYNIFALFDGSQASPEIDWGAIAGRAAEKAPGLTSLAPFCLMVGADCPLKGYYINFTRPVDYRPAERRLTWRDLALDIWAPANGQPLVLDEEEYRALELSQKEPALARAIEQAREELLRQAQMHTGPFAPIAS